MVTKGSDPGLGAKVEKCGVCNGTGKDAKGRYCPACAGTGTATDWR
jgi:DnaJ-class molecular chaperone